jgi:PRTRC genetic system protein B
MMNTSVNIGSSQEFRLSHALLVYGKSSYDGIPYRHPFVTMHDVIHESDGARLTEGQLVTPRMLIDVMSRLGQAVPAEILPERVLVRTESVVAWWRPARQARMFFTGRAGVPILSKLNGKLFPNPPLVFKASSKHLWVRALHANQRPTGDTTLYVAPYWNCYDNGVVCTGSMRIPQEKSVGVIEQWEESFFRSEFTHASGILKHTRYPGGVLTMWRSLQGKEKFPLRYLARTKQTLTEFVNDHDTTYRNEHQRG